MEDVSNAFQHVDLTAFGTTTTTIELKSTWIQHRFFTVSQILLRSLGLPFKP